MNDPILEEVRRVRDAHSARFNYDLDAIFRDIKAQELKSGRKFISFARDKAGLGHSSPSTASPAPSLESGLPQMAPRAEL